MSDLKHTSLQLKNSRKHTTDNLKSNVQRKIPIEFKQFNRTIKVVRSDSEHSENHGYFSARNDQITLFRHNISDAALLHTFYHELVHCLLECAGRGDLSEDETLVDVVGGLLAQFMETSKFKE